MRILFVLLILTVRYHTGHAQVIISILLGDKLNSEKIEFGLDGGFSLSDLRGLEPSSGRRSFNLGFYFDVRLKNPSWVFHTGVMVKSTMGAEDIEVYPLNIPDLDNAFKGGSVVRKLSYFNVPALMKYRWQNRFFVEGGPMFGLMYRATDEFVSSVNKKDDLSYELTIKDRYHPLDVGILFGTGYRLLKGNGMNLAIRYYFGLVNIAADNSPGQYNRSLYLAVGIPIGIGKKSAAAKDQGFD